jgi:hypothetical protein
MSSPIPVSMPATGGPTDGSTGPVENESTASTSKPTTPLEDPVVPTNQPPPSVVAPAVTSTNAIAVAIDELTARRRRAERPRRITCTAGSSATGGASTWAVNISRSESSSMIIELPLRAPERADAAPPARQPAAGFRPDAAG